MDTTPPLGMAAGVASTVVAGAVRDVNEVRSVDRAASLLIALGEAEAEVGVAELARRLGLHKSTASRLLATLRQRGLVQQDDDSGKYRLGLAVVRLGDRAEKTLDVRSIAAPEVEAVARSVRESTTLGMLDGDRVVAVAWADASGRGHYRMVVSMPLHATAPGKVLLACRPERDVIRLSKVGFTPYTSRTIVRVDLLLEELARVRNRGFATAFGEHEPTVNAVAMPVFDRRSSVVAALEVRASGNRIPPSRVPELIEVIRVAAAIITARIGGVAPSG